MILIGSKAFIGKAGTKYRLRGDESFGLHALDDNGEVLKVIGSGTALDFKCREDTNLYLKQTSESSYVSIQEVEKQFNPADPVPVEIEDKKPLTLKQELEKFIVDAVRHTYGQGSDQLETLEESMDFDLDDDEVPLSGYEVLDLVEEFMPEFKREQARAKVQEEAKRQARESTPREEVPETQAKPPTPPAQPV